MHRYGTVQQCIAQKQQEKHITGEVTRRQNVARDVTSARSDWRCRVAGTSAFRLCGTDCWSRAPPTSGVGACSNLKTIRISHVMLTRNSDVMRTVDGEQHLASRAERRDAQLAQILVGEREEGGHVDLRTREHRESMNIFDITSAKTCTAPLAPGRGSGTCRATGA